MRHSPVQPTVQPRRVPNVGTRAHTRPFDAGARCVRRAQRGCASASWREHASRLGTFREGCGAHRSAPYRSAQSPLLPSRKPSRLRCTAPTTAAATPAVATTPAADQAAAAFTGMSGLPINVPTATLATQEVLVRLSGRCRPRYRGRVEVPPIGGVGPRPRPPVDVDAVQQALVVTPPRGRRPRWRVACDGRCALALRSLPPMMYRLPPSPHPLRPRRTRRPPLARALL